MKKRNVYVVTQGDYSEYGIVAIHSSRKAAETHIAKGNEHLGESYRDTLEIEEWTLNEFDPYGKQWYRVVLKRNGDTNSCEPTGYEDRSYFRDSFISYVPIWRGCDVDSLGICVYVSAKSLDGAVKIANEHRLKEISLNHWGIEVPNNPAGVWMIHKEAKFTVVSGESFKAGSEVSFFHESVGNVVGMVKHSYSTEMYVKKLSVRVKEE